MSRVLGYSQDSPSPAAACIHGPIYMYIVCTPENCITLYCNSGKLLREKTFENCGYLQKFSMRNLGVWHLLVPLVSNLRKFSL